MSKNGGTDLPATRGRADHPPSRPRPEDQADFGDLPLPVSGGGTKDLPSPIEDHVGLPAVGQSADKPARQITGAALGFGEPDRSFAPAVASSSTDPALGDAFGELDLPMAADAGLPMISDDANLPSTLNINQDLPSPSDPDKNLPSTLDINQQLPSPLDLDQQLPADLSPGGGSADDLFGSSSVQSEPPSGGLFPDGMPPAPRPSEASGFGSVPPMGGATSAPIGSAAMAPYPKGSASSIPRPPSVGAFGSLPPQTPSADSEVTRQAGGGTSFGEVNLSEGEGTGAAPDVAPPDPSVAPSSVGENAGGEDDMEFGAIPQEEEDGSSSEEIDQRHLEAETAAHPTVPHPPKVTQPSKKSKVVKILLVALLVLLAGGIALSATPLGAFGIHFISDTVNAGRYQTMLDETISGSRSKFASDTAAQATRALEEADAFVADAPRFSPIAAYAAYMGYLREIRFGADSAVHAHAGALLARAAEDGKNAKFLSLARAAQAAANGEVAKARQSVQGLARRDANNIDVAVLEGEIELMANEYKTALVAWERAAKIEKSARTSFGQARAHLGLGNTDKAKLLTEQTLAQQKNHVGVRILMARLFDQAKGAQAKVDNEEQAAKLLMEIVGPDELPAVRTAASRSELVTAHTRLGQIHLARSRMSASETSFGAALKLDPKDADGLCGFGEVLYREGRYAEALARFEAGVQANAESVAAQIGAAKTKIALERLQDAKQILSKLRQTRPGDPVVAFWLAKVEEALNNKSEVEKILVDAIGRDPKGKEAIDLHVALAQFLAAQGRMQEADAKLAQARRKLPDSPAIHKALGSVALYAGRLNEAKKEFEIALQRD
ncbi:MAG: hypothetical protein CSA75_01135, partial [Sorangium cellulosum]